jgi:ribosomal protein S18 acetylase RimI-like enzyme
LRIIKADVGQIDAAAELFDQYRQFYGQESDIAGAEAFLADRLSEGESVVFLASRDGVGSEQVGFAQLYPVFSSISMQRLWILNDLFVAPDTRSRGIGRALIERCFELARATGAKGVALETMKDNHRAKALYESLGFQIDAHCDHYEWIKPS